MRHSRDKAEIHCPPCILLKEWISWTKTYVSILNVILNCFSPFTKRINTRINDIIRSSQFSCHSTAFISKQSSAGEMSRPSSVDWKLGYVPTSHLIKAQERTINCLRGDLSKGIDKFEKVIHLNDIVLFERVHDRGWSTFSLSHEQIPTNITELYVNPDPTRL
jgi:hypothetical protein